MRDLATMPQCFKEGCGTYVINMVDNVCTTYFLSLSVRTFFLKFSSVVERNFGIGNGSGHEPWSDLYDIQYTTKSYMISHTFRWNLTGVVLKCSDECTDSVHVVSMVGLGLEIKSDGGDGTDWIIKILITVCNQNLLTWLSLYKVLKALWTFKRRPTLLTTSFSQSGPGEVDSPIVIADPSRHSSMINIKLLFVLFMTCNDIHWDTQNGKFFTISQLKSIKTQNYHA